MIRITQLKLRPDEPQKLLKRSVRKVLHLKEGEAFSFEVLRRSIDARKKPDLYVIYTVLVRFDDPETEKRVLRRGLKNAAVCEPVRYGYSCPDSPGRSSQETDALFSGRLNPSMASPGRPLIVGTGPAGLFCGLLLARHGLRPILIERGSRVAQRRKSVGTFWENGELNPDSNVQFGEGGAGTFSDGKLNTGVRDPQGRIRFVLETFARAGAGNEILQDAKPHVGTDVLGRVVTALSDEITARGGEIFFETRMDRMLRDDDGVWQVFCTRRTGTKAFSGPEEHTLFSSRHLVLAIGHSARDTFRMLHDMGIVMHPKAFAAGVRIQHPQEVIDRALYGDPCRYHLPAASYKLTHRLPDGRGVYSFCMCPGGYVVNASSESGMLAVNGMSNHDRASLSANSAIVVTVSPEEIRQFLSEQEMPGWAQGMHPDGCGQENSGPSGSEDALIGVEFQRRLERAAFLAGSGAIPVQRFGDFTAHPSSCSEIRLPGYEPRIMGRWNPASIRQIFPGSICRGIEEGIFAWERQIRGFSSPDAILCAAESRTSSPVRIERGEDFQAPGYPGLYPCGEGAGYAGGITSAAADGLKAAEKILESYERFT